MDSVKIVPTKELMEFNKKMESLLLNGEVIACINDESNGTSWAKVTMLSINNYEIYGLWEMSLFSDNWKLNIVGEFDKVKKEWIECTSELQNLNTVLNIRGKNLNNSHIL